MLSLAISMLVIPKEFNSLAVVLPIAITLWFKNLFTEKYALTFDGLVNIKVEQKGNSSFNSIVL